MLSQADECLAQSSDHPTGCSRARLAANGIDKAVIEDLNSKLQNILKEIPAATHELGFPMTGTPSTTSKLRHTSAQRQPDRTQARKLKLARKANCKIRNALDKLERTPCETRSQHPALAAAAEKIVRAHAEPEEVCSHAAHTAEPASTGAAASWEQWLPRRKRTAAASNQRLRALLQ